jgi:hypothetical protein
MKNKELLETEIKKKLETLSELDMGTTEYESAVDSIVKLLDRSIDMERLEVETEEKERERIIERDLKQQQMIEDRKDRWIKNGIAIGGVILPTIVTVWGTLKSFKFEETGTVTTIMGRGFINKLLPKK